METPNTNPSCAPSELSSTSDNNPGGQIPNTSGSGGDLTITNIPIAVRGPENIILTERIMCDHSWPTDLVLDRWKYNWKEWSQHVTRLAHVQGFTEWLDGTLKRPDPAVYPQASMVWEVNDGSIWAFMLMRVSDTDYARVSHLREAHEVFEGLRKIHESLYDQVFFIKEALQVRFDPNIPFSTTIAKLNSLHNRIMNRGGIDDDRLLTIFLINALDKKFEQLELTIDVMSAEPGFSSNTLIRYLQELRPMIYKPIAFAGHGTGDKSTKLLCSNCKRSNHSADYCIQPGGKMAGCSIKEARAAQRTASGPSRRHRRGKTAHVATPSGPQPSTMASVIINGVLYIPANA